MFLTLPFNAYKPNKVMELMFIIMYWFFAVSLVAKARPPKIGGGALYFQDLYGFVKSCIDRSYWLVRKHTIIPVFTTLLAEISSHALHQLIYIVIETFRYNFNFWSISSMRSSYNLLIINCNGIAILGCKNKISFSQFIFIL